MRSSFASGWFLLLLSLLLVVTTHRSNGKVDAFVVAPNVAVNSRWRRPRIFDALPLNPSTQLSYSLPDHFFLDTATIQGSSVSTFFNSLFSSSSFWSIATTLVLVGLLYVWEEAIATARRNSGTTLMPVVDSMLAEMGGLGFIGLFLSAVVTAGPLGPTLALMSEQFLGDEHILLETFEFLHTAFFEVGVLFFIIAGWTVAKVLKKIESLADFSRVLFDTDCNGNVCLDDLANILNVDTVIAMDFNQEGTLNVDECRAMVRSIPKDTIWDELFIPTSKIQAEALVMRERFVRLGQVAPSFRIEAYCEHVFGENLREMVELSPLTWLPLVPAVAVGRTVDMTNDVISAASANAAASSGCFLGSAAFFWSSSFLSLLTLVWGCFNFWKVSAIKQMLLPVLVRNTADDLSNSRLSSKLNDGNTNGVLFLPPRYEDEEFLKEFNSSPGLFGWIERWLCRDDPAQHAEEDETVSKHVKLFGSAGKEGPELYRNSIKFHTWAVVVQIVFWGTQIVARDAKALLEFQGNGNIWSDNVGIPELVVPELWIFGLYVVVAAAQLFLVPLTFLSYSLITSVEDYFDSTFSPDLLLSED